MSLSKLPSGRWGAQVWNPKAKGGEGGNVRVSSVLGPDYKSFATKREANAARALARAKLQEKKRSQVTVGDWWDRWTTDPLWAREKESTMIRHAERTKPFVAAHRSMALVDVDEETVAEWLMGGERNSHVPGLRVMWNNAKTAKAGALTRFNPWSGLGLEQGKGNANKTPPTEQMVRLMIHHADRLSGKHFAGWLQLACFTGMRPGEIDGLRWGAIDWDASRIHVLEQWNANSHDWTPPKNGRTRQALLTPQARQALIGAGIGDEEDFCLSTLRGTHWRPSSRAYHWRSVKAAVDWEDTLYLATRHFAGWYMTNVLDLDSEDVAFALGHEDGGELVRKLYGHRDRKRGLARVQEAYENAGQVIELKPREETA